MARRVEVRMVVLSETDTDDEQDIAHWLRVTIEDELGWDVDSLEIRNLDTKIDESAPWIRG